MNIGERNELLIKIKLVKMRDAGGAIDGLKVESVGYNNVEYNECNLISETMLAGLSNIELVALADKMGIKKASVFEKSDVYINRIGFSVKSFSSAPPALVNHTTRPGFETACNYSHVRITDLDSLIDEYWSLRSSGIIREDVSNAHPCSPFKESIDIIGPVLKYFLFKGSGKGLSKYPADYILDYYDPLNEKTWKVLDSDSVIRAVWDRLIFSLRATKGMPKNYPNNYRTENNDSIAKWTRFFQGKYRGALHIRVKA